MEPMSSSTVEPADLLDLKLLPAWVKEPVKAKNYAHYTGEEKRRRPRNQRNHEFKRSMLNINNADPHERKKVGRDALPRDRFGAAKRARRQKDGGKNRHERGRHHENRPKVFHSITPLDITIHFLPYSPAFESVVAQIKSGLVAYSLFALARLFLEKPVRYEVRLTAKAESPLYQLGENGAVSLDREFLERNAFRFAHEDFYKIDITQSDPVKGNFSNVARCRLSGTLLGPTNHHNYQPRLRSLYEQRFNHRMSFADYQRQIEIVNHPALIERWKEEARRVMTYTTLREETPLTFASATEVERHFRSNYLPGLLRSVEVVAVDGVLSRRLPDRALNRAVEDAWTRETHSPSNMMQELAGRFRQAGLNVFRHRRGMLFVSPIRVRPFVHDQAGVCPLVNAILEALAATPGISRKELFEKVITDPANEEAESRKLALASDVRWLINEGYVIEFNDGSLDLPRGKAKPQEIAAAVVSTAETGEQALTGASASTAPAGGKASEELVDSESPPS